MVLIAGWFVNSPRRGAQVLRSCCRIVTATCELSNSSVLVTCTHAHAHVGEIRTEFEFAGMVGFLSKSFRAATGVKGLEGKFEVQLQGRYSCFRELSRTSESSASESNPSHQGMPRGHAPSSRATTPAHDHATSPLHVHAHSTRTLARSNTLYRQRIFASSTNLSAHR